MKPTGKLRFMTAYRFYRRDEVPRVKEENPDLDGKARHAVVRQRWQKLPDKEKVAYVMMSRLDRERAIYMNKLSQIRENLLMEFPTLETSRSDAASAEPDEDYEEYRRQLIAFRQAEQNLHLERLQRGLPFVASQAFDRIQNEIKEGNKIIYEDEQEYSADAEESKDHEAHVQSLPNPDISSIQVAKSNDEHGSSITFPTSNEQSSNSASSGGNRQTEADPPTPNFTPAAAGAPEPQSKTGTQHPEEPETIQIDTSKPRGMKQNQKQVTEYEESKEGFRRAEGEQILSTTVENGKRFTQLGIMQFFK